ncbi:hypothetical protein [Lysinibacillus sp. FW12]|uniref:hypothetical protein n=1 Tax=Lysinibacillus sp. FW12 TaxID=3096079 RepID=UPI003D7480FA
MIPFEENIKIWNDTLEEISHPIYKSILNNFHIDLIKEISFNIQAGIVQKDFDSIMNYSLKYILQSLFIQIKKSKEFELMVLVFGDKVCNEFEKLLLLDAIDISYHIDDFITEKEMEEEGITVDDLDNFLNIIVNFNEKQFAMLKLTNSVHELGELAFLNLDTSDTFINGNHYSDYEEE